MVAAESDPLGGGRSDLTIQVLEQFDAGKMPLDAIADSDLPVTAADDRYPAWHPDAYPSKTIVKALFVAKLRGFSFARLHRVSTSRPDRAAALGFDPDRIPHRSVLSRAWRFRLTDELRTLLSESADRVIAETHPLASQHAYLADTTSETRESAGHERTSESTSGGSQDSITTQQLTEVTTQLRRHIAGHFETDRADNTRYPDTAFYDLQSSWG